MNVVELTPTKVFPGTLIAPSELLELAEFATPRHDLSEQQLVYEADNLAEWCDGNPALAQHAALLARGTGHRPEVVAVLDELAHRDPPASRLALSA
jgi:hypothetical protein